MFQAMRNHRRYCREPKTLPQGKTLEKTTIHDARSFRTDNELGSLRPGKKADIILVDMRKPHLHPLNMPVDKITCFANGNDVDTVIVDGKGLMENSIVKGFDELEVLDLAQGKIDVAVGRSGLKILLEATEDYWSKSRY